MFCSLKDGRSPPIGAVDDAERVAKCAAIRIAPDIDPMKIFIDSPVYRETKIRDEDAYKGGELDAIKPFGEVFQQEKQFEEDVFEPESPFGEKTFTQQHPLFGDFGVKYVKGRVVDEREKQLAESPEYPTPEALNDPELRQPGYEADPEAGAEAPVEEIFDDKTFDEQPPEEQPQSFEKQDFDTSEGAQEATPSEQAPEATEEAPPEPERQETETAEATEANPEATEANPEDVAEA